MLFLKLTPAHPAASILSSASLFACYIMSYKC
jgi:hypothetical protein